MKKRIHVNQHAIRANNKNDTTNPVLSIKSYKNNQYASRVDILGESRVVYSPHKPLSCGAQVWIETDAEIVLDERRVV